MGMRVRFGAIFAAMVLMVSPAWAQEAPATRLSPATGPAALDARWQEMLQGLESADFKEREAAQKQLEAITWRECDQLRRLAASTSDMEAKTRILNRVEVIEADLAVNPPPISLEVKNAALSQVGIALEKALGITFEDSASNFGGRQGGYTLTVREKPFWEVFQALSEQHGISLQGWGNLRMIQQEPGLRKGVINGSLVVFPQSITRSTTVQLQKPEGQQVEGAQLNLQYVVALDPRVRIAQSGQPEMTEVIDDAGNVLYTQDPRNAVRIFGNQQTHVWQAGVGLKIPENMGKKIASAKGQFRYTAQLAAERFEITDVEKKLDKPQELGGVAITFSRFSVKGNTIEFSMNARSTRPQIPIIGGIVRGNDPSMEVAFVGADGRRLWTTSMSPNGGASGGVGGNIVEPVKVVLSMPTKTKEMVVNFELKDLPLP